MEISTASRYQIENDRLCGPSAVISMADCEGELAVIKDADNVRARLSLIFHDTSDPFQIVRPPSDVDARRILQFASDHGDLPYLVAQCQVGIGRSHAVAAALMKIQGQDNRQLLGHGTYNRRLYQLLLAAANLTPEPEPLVSINVRVKYAPDRLQLFLLSMQRQRYDNWEVIAVTDGQNAAAAQMIAEMREPRVRLIETKQVLGQWGHPYRQQGFEACRGEFIGMANDDNYFVPGYLEQMVGALAEADLAVCWSAHSAQGWDWTKPGWGAGSWIARASLVRRLPWTEEHHLAGLNYVRKLLEMADGRVAQLHRLLFVHN